MIDRREFVNAPTSSSTQVEQAVDLITRAGSMICSGNLTLPETRRLGSEVRKAYTLLLRARALTDLSPVMPFLLRINGQPMSTRNHFPMEPMLYLRLPREFMAMTGRQVAKSTFAAGRIVTVNSAIDHFRTMYIAPRFEQTRVFSNDRVGPMIADSPMFRSSERVEKSILRREFPVSAAMVYFMYAFMDCERSRGYSTDCNFYDEVQDLQWRFLAILDQTMSASPYKQRIYTGTPKTLDGTAAKLWSRSTQSEFVIPCSCGYWNIPSLKHDLLKMIQRDGPSCASCGRLLNPELGRYEHAYPDRAGDFIGIHAPKIIFPMHYRPNPLTGAMDDWLTIYNKKESGDDITTFYNEDLGEPYDTRTSLITEAELVAMSVLGDLMNDLDSAAKVRSKYRKVYLGIDWGGGGKKGISMTACAVIGARLDGKFDILFMTKLVPGLGGTREAMIIKAIWDKLRPDKMPYDLSAGAGNAREAYLASLGIPLQAMVPMSYVAASPTRMLAVPQTDGYEGREYVSVDRSRAITGTFEAMRNGFVRAPAWSAWSRYAKDFLSMMEDKRSNVRGSDVYIIDTKAGESDDLVHAVTFAAVMYWYDEGFPNYAKNLMPGLNQEQVNALHPKTSAMSDWKKKEDSNAS